MFALMEITIQQSPQQQQIAKNKIFVIFIQFKPEFSINYKCNSICKTFSIQILETTPILFSFDLVDFENLSK